MVLKQSFINKERKLWLQWPVNLHCFYKQKNPIIPKRRRSAIRNNVHESDICQMVIDIRCAHI